MNRTSTSKRHARRGGAVVLVLFAIVPLLLALGALLTVAAGQHGELEQQVARGSAAATSFSGAQDALSRLELTRTLNGEYELQLNGGVARVNGLPWRTDGVDNDENGLIDDAAEENFFAIRADAWLNALPDGEAHASVESYHAATDVLAELIDFDFAFGQAIYVDDPAADIDFNGGAFELSGRDENLDGSSGAATPRPAVGTPGNPAQLISQISSHQEVQVVGNLPDPAIGTTGALAFADYLAMLEPLATMDWTALDASYSGAIGNLAAKRGIVAHAKGDLKLHGTTTGAGVLIVEGDLEIDGHFDFAGVILVQGNVSFQGGGGAKELHGALLVWGDDGAQPEHEDLEINGTVQVAYSTEGLEIASTSGGVRVLFWRDQ
jgi:hypothetical protein